MAKANWIAATLAVLLLASGSVAVQIDAPTATTGSPLSAAPQNQHRRSLAQLGAIGSGLVQSGTSLLTGNLGGAASGLVSAGAGVVGVGTGALGALGSIVQTSAGRGGAALSAALPFVLRTDGGGGWNPLAIFNPITSTLFPARAAPRRSDCVVYTVRRRALWCPPSPWLLQSPWARTRRSSVCQAFPFLLAS